MNSLRSPMVMAAAIAGAVVLALVGAWFQVHSHNPAHPVSYHAIAFWALAVVALIGASFARPQAG